MIAAVECPRRRETLVDDRQVEAVDRQQDPRAAWAGSSFPPAEGDANIRMKPADRGDEVGDRQIMHVCKSERQREWRRSGVSVR